MCVVVADSLKFMYILYIPSGEMMYFGERRNVRCNLKYCSHSYDI